MHYFHAQNQERAAVCLSSRCSELVRFLALSQIKPQAPLLVVLLPSILLNFIIANIHSTKTAVGFPHSASCVGVVAFHVVDREVCGVMSIHVTCGYEPHSLTAARLAPPRHPKMSSFTVKITRASNPIESFNFRS